MSILTRIFNSTSSIQPNLAGKAGLRKLEHMLSDDYKQLRTLVGTAPATQQALVAALFARPHILRTVITDFATPEQAWYDPQQTTNITLYPFDYTAFQAQMKASNFFNDLSVKLQRHAELYTILDPITFAACIAALLIKLR